MERRRGSELVMSKGQGLGVTVLLPRIPEEASQEMTGERKSMCLL